MKKAGKQVRAEECKCSFRWGGVCPNCKIIELQNGLNWKGP